MPDDRPSTLHAIRALAVGEAAALSIGPRDPVLVVGHADRARAVARVLGRPVRSAPEPRLATPGSLARLAERVRRATRADAVLWHGSQATPDPAAAPDPDPSILPDRLAARRALGFAGELVIAPLADRPEAVDARTMLFIAGVIEIIGERIAVALPAGARRLDEALAYHRSAGLKTPVRIVDDAWLCALPAADLFVAPIDSDDDPAAPALRAIADSRGIPIATTASWHRDPAAATEALPAEIRATVAPVLAEARGISAGGRTNPHAGAHTEPTIPA